MKKEIWDWLHPKLCRNAGNHSIKNPLKAGSHARSSAAGLEKRRISSITFHMTTKNASSFSPVGCWSDSRTVSGVGVDVDETEGVSGGMESFVIGVLGQRGGFDHIIGVEEALGDTPSLDIIQEKPHDLSNHIIRSLQPSDDDRVKEIYCGFSFLFSRKKHRRDVFNAFRGIEKNGKPELKSLSGDKASVGILKKIFSLKIDGCTSILHCQQPKVLEKIKRVFLKKTGGAAKKLGDCLIQNTSKVEDALEGVEQENMYVYSALTKEEDIGSQFGAADYRIMVDSDYVVLEW